MKTFFKKLGAWIKKHKKLVILLAILLTIGGFIGYIAYSLSMAKDVLSDLANAGEVAQIERRSLVDSLSATGKVSSIDSQDIAPAVSGVDVLEVPVSVGDYVKAGDVICVLDTEDLQMKLNDLQTTLNVTKQKADANVAIAGRGLNEARTTEGVQVYRDFEDAQDLYDDYMDALDDVDKAQREYDASVEQLYYRQAEYESYRSEHSDLDEYDFLNKTERGNFYKTKFDSAKSEMESKEKALDNMKDAADAALDKYNNLIRSYEDHERNNDSTVMTRNDSVKSAKLDQETANLNTSEQIKQYEDQIAACTVTAPFDGVITALNVSEGGRYAGGSAVATIEDDSEYEIVAEIDEYDISKVKVGQKVIIKTNGTGDLEFNGQVKEVAPRATKTQSASGVSASANVTYKVTVSVDAKKEDLKMDMTAKMSIILDEKMDVLTVPYDAVQTDEDGKLYIEVADETAGVEGVLNKYNNGGKPGEETEKQKIYVEKGIESDYYVEVIGDGVKEGISIFVPSANGMNDFLQMMMDQGAMGGM